MPLLLALHGTATGSAATRMSAWSPEHEELLSIARNASAETRTAQQAWDRWLAVLVGGGREHATGWLTRIITGVLVRKGFRRLLAVGFVCEYVQGAGEKLYRLARDGYLDNALDQGKLATSVVLNYLWDQVSRDLPPSDMNRSFHENDMQVVSCPRATAEDLARREQQDLLRDRIKEAGLRLLGEGSPIVSLVLALCFYPSRYQPSLLQAVAGLVRPRPELEPALDDLLESLAASPADWAKPWRCRWYRDELARLLFTRMDLAAWQQLTREESTNRQSQLERGQLDGAWKGLRSRKKNQLDNVVRRARRAREELAGLKLATQLPGTGLVPG